MYLNWGVDTQFVVDWYCLAGTIEYSNVADLGFGLSDIAIRSLDVIHATTGMPWWATIIATTFAVRTLFFPITVISVRPSSLSLTFVVVGHCPIAP